MNEKHNFWKSIILGIIYFIIFLIVVYDLVLIIQTTIHPEQTPDLFGFKAFNIVSDSMSPVININDLIIVKKSSEYEIELNDIISYKSNDEIITHRIIKTYEKEGKKFYITKGDNSEFEDSEKINFENIEGKYAFKISKIGNILKIFKNKIIYIAILTILIIGYIFERKKINKKIERKIKRRKFERNKKNVE